VRVSRAAKSKRWRTWSRTRSPGAPSFRAVCESDVEAKACRNFEAGRKDEILKVPQEEL